MNTKHNKLKGSSKQAVIVTNPDGTLYEQAIFILRRDEPMVVGQNEILQEAERIIKENSFPIVFSAKQSRRALWTVLTVSIIVSLLVGISVLLFVLL